jgi:hypothetical protein
VRDTHDEPDALDAADLLVLLPASPDARPRRLADEWQLWVEVLRRGDELHIQLADLLTAHFTRGRGRPRDATLPTATLALRLDLLTDELWESGRYRRRGDAHAEAVKVLARQHKVNPDTLRKRLRRSAARDR